MKQTITESIPWSIPGLQIFIKECDKEIGRIDRLRKQAQKSLDVKQGKIEPSTYLNPETPAVNFPADFPEATKGVNFRGDSKFQIENGLGTSKEGTHA